MLSVGKELLPELLSGLDGLAKLIESVLNQVLEAQVSDSLGAARKSARVTGMVIGPTNSIHEMGLFQPKYLNAISIANKPLYWYWH